MKEIFCGEVYDMVKKTDGLVFSYMDSMIDDSRFIMGYKMLDAKTGVLSEIAKNVYFLAKYGSNYKPAVSVADNYITSKAINLPSGKLFLCNKSGECFLLDGDGATIWTGVILYRDNPPSDIALYKNCIWASFSENNVLIRFNMATMREELRIGGSKSPFEKPKGIFIEDNTATVSNIGSNRLTKVNLDNYSVEQYLEFNQPVRDYIKVGTHEFVLLKNGIYEI